MGCRESRGRLLRHQVGGRESLRADRAAVRNKLCRGGARCAASRPQRGDFRRQGSRRLDRAAATGARAQARPARTPWVFEVGIDPSFQSEVPVFKEISKFPAIRRDLAVVVDESVTLDELRESVNLAAKGLLRELAVFDVYRGKGVEPGRKSIALGLILQETSRTLTDGEADSVVAAVIERVKGDLKAGIRE